MKVIFDIPDKYVDLAEATLVANAADHEEERIKKAVSACKKRQNLIPSDKFEEPDQDIKQMYLAFAIMAIAVEIDKSSK